jgi:hypothetical protein
MDWDKSSDPSVTGGEGCSGERDRFPPLLPPAFTVEGPGLAAGAFLRLERAPGATPFVGSFFFGAVLKNEISFACFIASLDA